MLVLILNKKMNLAKLFGLLLFIFVFVSLIPGQERFRKTPPLPEPLQPLKLPQVETLILKNGLTVAVVQTPVPEMATIHIIIRTGEKDSPIKLPGLAAVTARMIGKGTKVLSADDIESLIEGIGGEFSISVAMDSTIISVQVREEFFDRALVILRQILLEATFPELELAAVKRNYYYELQQRRKEPELAGERQLIRLVFDKSSYGVAGYSEDVITLITRKDVVAFYNLHYRPNNAVILIFGSLPADRAAGRIDQHFRMWQPDERERKTPILPPSGEETYLCFLENPGVKEAVVIIGRQVPFSPTDEKYFPFIVLNQILGGTTRSRLFMKLRELRGHAFYAFSIAEFYQTAGLFWVKARARPENLVEAIRDIMSELELAANKGFSPDEIEEAKAYLVGNMPLKFMSIDSFNHRFSMVLALNLGQDFLNKAPDNIMLVNLERVEKLAREYLSGSFTIVVVGDISWLDELIKYFGKINIYNSLGYYKQTLSAGDR